MILAFLSALPVIAVGWLLVRLLLPVAWKPAWLRWLFELSLGTGLGAGLTSCIYFLFVWAGIGRWAELGVEAAALAGGAWLLSTRKRSLSEPAPARRFSWNWLLRLAAVLALLLFAMDFGQGIGASPNGEWDAFSIWNLRAKFLAGGAPTWRYAVSNDASGKLIGAAHPGYPLLLSASVARLWTLTGALADDTSSGAPAVLSLLFSLATMGLLCGTLGWMRAESSALLAVLVLLATEEYVSQGATQYADIPLSFFILAAVALLAYAAEFEWPPGALILSGLAAGFAAWTKNEGLPFLALFLAVVAWRGWRRTRTWNGARELLQWAAAGVAPGALVTIAFKLFVAPPGGEAVLPKTFGEAVTKLGNPGRWGQIVGSFLTNFLDLGVWWAHPVLLLIVLGFTLRFVRKQEAFSRLWLLAPVAGLLAADVGVYLTTRADLKWHLATSNSRLFVQIWPVVLLVFFLILQAPVSPEPEAAAAETMTEPQRRRTKRGATQGVGAAK